MGGRRLPPTGAHGAAGTLATGASPSRARAAYGGEPSRRAHAGGAPGRPGPLPVRARVIGAVALAAAGAVGLVAAAPAWADTSPILRDKHVLAAVAADQGTGHCGVPQRPDQDVWVFTWPGGNPGSLEHVTVRYDSDGDEVAETSRTEADATRLSSGRVLRYAITTPSGWLLVDGTSLITGTSAQNQFVLSAVCAGQASPPLPDPGASATRPAPGGRPSGTATGPANPGGQVPGSPAVSASPSASAAYPAPVRSAPRSPSTGLGPAGGSGARRTSVASPAGGAEARLASAARPVLPYAAAVLLLVAIGSMLVGARRRRAEAWAGFEGDADRRRHAARHRRT